MTQIRTWTEAEARLAESLPGYESRPQQTALAQAVEETLAQGGALLAQAGCGTGKSLASMIPAILSGKRVLVVTATKALMNQYVSTDVPFLSEHLGVPFTWAMLKGRSNYLCHAKMAAPDARVTALVGAIQAEVDEDLSHTGDLDDVQTPVTDLNRMLLTSTSEECPGKRDCPFGDICYAERAKARAKEAKIVVTNTAMLMTDLKIREATGGEVAMLGEYDAVVIDEAHELEDIATSQLADTLRESGIRRLCSEVETFAGSQSAVVDAFPVRDALTDVWAALPPKTGNESVMTLRYFMEHELIFTTLIGALNQLAEDVSEVDVLRDEKKAEAKRAILATRATRYAERIAEIMLADDDDLVRWIEEDDKGNRLFKAAPISVAPFLTAHLWTRTTSVLVSATLSVGGSFDYMQERLGLEGCRTLNVGTPFDYETQAALYVPDGGIVSPKERQGWLTIAPELAMQLIEASKGGALVLCTSRDSLRQMHEALAPRLSAKGINVYRQGGDDGTNKEIARKFAEDTHSVLIATKSFFTGVDFRGDTCRLVIIDKLPFPVPSDVMFSARSAQVDRQARQSVSFRKLSIPMMTLVLEQGFGRLIRSRSDRGVVAILDSRLSSTGYGRQIVGNLPDCPATTDLDAVRDFYAGAR